jgi:hypothetical protein
MNLNAHRDGQRGKITEHTVDFLHSVHHTVWIGAEI